MTKPIEYAHEIVAAIEKAVKQEDFYVQNFPVDCKTKSVAEAVNKILQGRDFRGRVSLYQSPGEVRLIIRAITYTEKLERMVRKLAMHVDSDSLYEEALALVEVI